jgi:hypothetical protein
LDANLGGIQNENESPDAASLCRCSAKYFSNNRRFGVGREGKVTGFKLNDDDPD